MTWILKVLLALGLSLGSGGDGVALTGEQVAQIAYQAGFRGEDLVNMVAIVGRESRFDPAARRTDNPGGVSAGTGDFGLAQINYSNWPKVKQALGLTHIDQLLDPLTNLRAAKLLHSGSGFAPWAAGSGGFTAGGDPLHGTNVTAARGYVQAASEAGKLGEDWTGGGGPVGGVTRSGTVETTPITLPSDAKVYLVGNSAYAVFSLNGVMISYSIDWAKKQATFDPAKAVKVSAQEWKGMKTVNAGDVEELRDLKVTWGTYGRYWNSILDTVLGKHNEARQDAGVLNVIAQFAGRPDMTPQELNNLLQGTSWYQKHTEDQLAWNSLGREERRKRTDEMAARMVNTWFEFTGEPVNVNDPRIKNYLEQVASGKMGFGAWTETVVKRAALEIGESPWNRQLREERTAQRAWGVDVENTAQQIKDLARRWGVRWSDRTYQDWARKVVDKQASDADILKALQNQSSVMFPWKDPNIDVETAAAPWVQTLNRVMETNADHMDPKVLQAMSGQMSVWDFEKSLKKSAEWTGTKNAREEMLGMAAEIGRRMGFVAT